MTYIIGLLSLHFVLQLFLPLGYPDIDDEDNNDYNNEFIMELPTNLKFYFIFLLKGYQLIK